MQMKSEIAGEAAKQRHIQRRIEWALRRTSSSTKRAMCPSGHLAAGWPAIADDELERQMFSDDCKRSAKAYDEGGLWEWIDWVGR